MSDFPLDQLKQQHPKCRDCRWWGKGQKAAGELRVMGIGNITLNICQSPRMRDATKSAYTNWDHYCPHWEAKADA